MVCLVNLRRAFYPLLVLFVFVLLASSCSQRFLIYKDGKAYHFAGKREGLYKMLCESGDFKRVLENSSTIPQATKKELYVHNCVTPTPDKVQELYVAMSVEQRKDLRESFKKEGYAINYFPCG